MGVYKWWVERSRVRSESGYSGKYVGKEDQEKREEFGDQAGHLRGVKERVYF
jgi:hypothetical protein